MKRKRIIKIFSSVSGFLLFALIIFISQHKNTILFTSLNAFAHVKSAYAEKLKYEGVNIKGEPFQLISATGNEINPSEVLFDNVSGTIHLKSGKQLKLDAKTGVYNKEDKNITLSGDVLLFHGNDLSFSTSKACININLGTAYNDAPVIGKKGEKALITANSFEITENNEVIFTGNPRMVIKQNP